MVRFDHAALEPMQMQMKAMTPSECCLDMPIPRMVRKLWTGPIEGWENSGVVPKGCTDKENYLTLVARSPRAQKRIS
jgi:hypothetical protein